MKSYTDLEQSKKLVEILPLESADYYHAPDADCVVTVPYIIKSDTETLIPAYKGAVPCWSLAALLSIIPKRIKGYNVLRIDIKNDFAMWYDEIGYGVNNDLPDITEDNSVDACYEMILKLHEQKLL